MTEENTGCGHFLKRPACCTHEKISRKYAKILRVPLEELTRIPDSFRKIVVVGNKINPWKDENGILYIGIEQFLLDEKAIDM